MKKILLIIAIVVSLLTVVSCAGAGRSQAQAQTMDRVTEESLFAEDKEDATALLSACRLGHYEHATELHIQVAYSGRLTPEDIGSTQYEIGVYQKLAKIRELVPAMTRIRAGRASPDGAAWVARQLREHSLEPVDVGTSWTELRKFGAKVD